MGYPDGMAAPSRHHDTMTCTNPDCGTVWTVEFITDLGSTRPANDEDVYCPDCGQEGE